MAERGAYPSPNPRWGKNLLADPNELYSRKYLSGVSEYIKKQQLIKPAKVAKENEFLKSSCHNVIFNSENTMILNKQVFDSFFEKLAEITMKQAPIVVKKETNKPETSIGIKQTRRRVYGGQKMPSITAYTGFKNRTGMKNTPLSINI